MQVNRTPYNLNIWCYAGFKGHSDDFIFDTYVGNVNLFSFKFTWQLLETYYVKQIKFRKKNNLSKLHAREHQLTDRNHQ